MQGLSYIDFSTQKFLRVEPNFPNTQHLKGGGGVLGKGPAPKEHAYFLFRFVKISVHVAIFVLL